MHMPEPVSGTILIVDREDQLARQRALFEQVGFSVLTAGSMEEGLRVAREHTPDLVVAEVMLEKPDAGFVLGYRMKQDPALASIPLVLLSSVFQQTGTIFDLTSPEARQWIKAEAYLEKPIAPERLIGKVRAVLQHPKEDDAS